MAHEIHEITSRFLKEIWNENPGFLALEKILLTERERLSPIEIAIIGRDLLIRRHQLFNRTFNMAAFLASDGEAGNDGFLDFTDCAALLVEERYSTILENPDHLIEDPMSSGFEECYLISKITAKFDEHMGLEDDDHCLHYLVFGNDSVDWDKVNSMTREETKIILPKLYQKFGHLLEPRVENLKPKSQSHISSSDGPVSLADLILENLPTSEDDIDS